MSNEKIARNLFNAFESGDMDAVRALCSADFKARQNLNTEFDLDTLIHFSQAVSSVVNNFRYEDIRCSGTEDGFVEEHIVCGEFSDGTPLKLAACVVATIHEGKITHLCEYVDTAAASALSKALA